MRNGFQFFVKENIFFFRFVGKFDFYFYEVKEGFGNRVSFDFVINFKESFLFLLFIKRLKNNFCLGNIFFQRIRLI